ncbi:RyR domain-containing protein, partial [Klebsiella pneumoniae]|uniref:RyR domain-containing protein n=1 Tax=Klebsiella pneumoniae TaxID=573 RepID=UPI0025A01B6B
AIYPHLRTLGYDLAPLTDWDAGLFRFSDEEVKRLAEMEHTRWVAERKAKGWQYHPTIRDPENKLSPALVPWTELEKDDRNKCVSTAIELP